MESWTQRLWKQVVGMEAAMQDDEPHGADKYHWHRPYPTAPEQRYYFTRGAGSDLCLIQKRVDYFLAEWQRGEVQLSREATRYEWATADDAMRMLRFPEKRRVLTRAVEWLAQRQEQPR
mgnify:CR=1 FL=1